jgi:P pilus assembly chaperone PapD
MRNSLTTQVTSGTQTLARVPVFLGPALLLATSLGCALLSSPARAEGVGDLLVSPTRVVFEGPTRNAEVALVNRGTKPALYRIVFEQRRVTEDGRMFDLPKLPDGEIGADQLVRYTPHQVVIKPGETQLVRIQLRKPSTLVEGEYRSHLTFRAVPEKTTGPSGNDDTANSVGVFLIPIYGVSIPVLVRHGQLSAQASFSDAAFTAATADAPPILSLTLNRAGAASLYGDLIVRLRPRVGQDVIVGRFSSLSVYTAISRRLLRAALELPKDYAGGGRLFISYVDHVDNTVPPYATCTLDLP